MLSQRTLLFIAGFLIALIALAAGLRYILRPDEKSEGMAALSSPAVTEASPPLRHAPGPEASSTDAVASYQYTPNGQLQAIVYADGTVYKYAYNAAGDKISETNRTGGTWTYSYDADHHPIRIIDPTGKASR